MTTPSPLPAETPTFSYAAAAASGQTASSVSAKQSASPASRSGVSTPASANAMTSTEHTRTATPRSAPSSSSGSRQKRRTDSSANQQMSGQSSPSLRTTSDTKEDDSESTTLTVPDEKSAAWEKSSQSSNHTDNRSATSDPGTKPVEYAPAAPPPVNVWKKRQEEMAAKAKSSVVPPLKSEAATNAEKSEKKRVLIYGTWDEKKGADDESDKVASRPETNGNGADAEDGYSKHPKSGRKGQQEREATTIASPPPVTDTTSWPTPKDIPQAEPKKEKKHDKDEERPTTSKKWVSVPIEPHYAPPIAVKSGRGGRGGSRGGREGGRGGAAAAGGDRNDGTGATGDSERGRNGNGSSSRGGYQGSKAPKRSSSASGTVRRRESKDITNGGPSGKKREPSGDLNLDGSAGGRTSSATQTDKAPREARDFSKGGEDSIAGGEFRQQADGFEKYPVNGQTHYPRPERGSHQTYGSGRPEPDGMLPYPPPPNGGFERGRGGYGRGRGGFRNHNSNSHHAGHFSAMPYNHTQYHNQFPPAAYPRGGFGGRPRGHVPFASNGPFRPNPQMQPPPYMSQYQATYDYTVNPVAGLPQEDIEALVSQINYYFSLENLLKDVYLRKYMSTEGFIPLSTIFGFNMIQRRTGNYYVFKAAAAKSDGELISNGVVDLIRPKNGWQQWVFPPDERHDIAKNDYRDMVSAGHATAEMSGSAQPFVPGGNAPPVYPAVPPYAYPSPVDAQYQQYGYPAQPLSADAPEFPTQFNQPNGETHPDLPAFMVDEIDTAGISDLMIVVIRRPGSGEDYGVSPETSPSRTRTNGNPEDKTTASAGLVNGDGTRDEPTVNGSAVPSLHRSQKSQNDISWCMGNAGEQKIDAKKLVHKPYDHFREKALNQRKTVGPAKNTDMITLYNFWHSYLPKKYNASLYREFKKFALEDADVSARSGVEYLYKFYENIFRRPDIVGSNLIQDFVNLSAAEAQHGEAFGVHKLKSIINSKDVSEPYKQKMQALMGDDLRGALAHGVGKKHEKSVAADSYVKLCGEA